MGRLKGEDLTKFAVKCKSFQKVGGTPRQIKFVHDSHADGNATYEIITRVYADCLFGTMSGLSRRDWTFKTNDEDERDEMFADLQECMAEYKAMLGEPYVPATNPSDDKEPDDEKKSADWTTYIIIGVAAAVIIALLIPWKRK